MRKKLVDLAIRGLTLGGKFVLIFAIARGIGPSDVGFYGLYTSTISIALYIVGLDFYTYSTRDILKHNAEGSYIWNVIYNQGIFFLASYLVVFVLWEKLFSLAGIHSLMTLGFFILIAEHLSQEIFRILVVIGKISESNIQLFIRSGLWCYICAVGVWFKLLSIDSVLMCWLVFATLAIAYGFFVLNRYEKLSLSYMKFNYDWIFRGVKVCIIFFVGTIFLRSVGYFDKVFARSVATLSEIGIYVFFIGIGSAVQSAIDLMVISRRYPELIRTIQMNEIDKSKVAFGLFKRDILFQGGGLYIISIPLCYIVSLSTGRSDYTDAFLWYVLIVISNVILNVSMPYHYVLYAKHKDKILVLANVFMLIIFCILCFLFIKFFSQIGMVGILISLLLSNSITTVIKIVLKKTYGETKS
ncbi:lipopolysaccharide biosynthesis protein [Serratia fonticola]